MAADTPKQRWIFLSIVMAVFMVTLDGSIVNISMPAMAHSFNVGASLISRVVLVYLLVLSSTVLFFGKLGDRLGLVRVFIGGYAIFTVGSLLCGLSPSLNLLIAARGIQGIGGAMLYAVTPAFVPHYFPVNRRGRTFGAVSAAAAIGLGLGPPLGGLITSCLGWQWIFFIKVPIGIAAMFVAVICLPKEPHVEYRDRFDVWGVILSCAGITTFLYVLNMGQENGWGSITTVCSFAGALVILALFMRVEAAQRDPLLDLRVFRSRRFSFANSANLLAFVVLGGHGFTIPFYLILAKGLTAGHAGAVVMVLPLAMMVVTPIAGRFADSGNPSLLCSAGMFSAAAACFCFALWLDHGSLVTTAVFLAVLGVSFSLFVSPNNTQVMNLSAPDQLGAMSGLLKTLSNLGQTFGVCLFETMLSQSLPANAVLSAGKLQCSPVLREGLLTGFQHTYYFAAAVCALAGVCSLVVGSPARSGERASG